MARSWKRIEPTTVEKISYKTIVTKTFELPDGRRETFGTFNREGWNGVAIIALTRENKVLSFRQFRPGPEKLMDEIPGGGVEEGENLEASATRELLEETGYTPGEMTYLGKCSYDAYTNGWRHAFLATGCIVSSKGASPEPNEEHGEVRLITIDELISNAREGRMTDPGAVLLGYDQLMELRGRA